MSNLKSSSRKRFLFLIAVTSQISIHVLSVVCLNYPLFACDIINVAVGSGQNMGGGRKGGGARGGRKGGEASA